MCNHESRDVDGSMIFFGLIKGIFFVRSRKLGVDTVPCNLTGSLVRKGIIF